MLTIENDDSLTQTQKARKRQQLIAGKAPAQDDEDEEEETEENQSKPPPSVWEMLSRTIQCSICLNLPERPVTVRVPLLLPSLFYFYFIYFITFLFYFNL